MKRTYTLLPLLAALFTSFVSAPATAQNILLQIDYQNNPIFHVLADGRVLLPLGAADGFVLTSDGNGYATWQKVSQDGGLLAVSSDTTLVGDGTAGDPLGVSVPLVLTGTANGIMQGRIPMATSAFSARS